MKNAHILPEDLDLSDIFIGRERQLNDFRVYLENWVRLASSSPSSPLAMPPSPNNKIQGFFVLLHGRGGFGKSTLLRHYHEIALEHHQELLVSEVVDWEAAVQDRRTLFNITDRENIDVYQYFHLIAKRLASALGKQFKEFSAYRTAEQATDKARKQAYDLLDQLQHNESFSWLRRIGMARDTLLGLVSMLNPGIGSVLGNDFVLEKMRDFSDAGTKVGIEHLQRLRQYLQEKLGKDLSDYLDAQLQLGLALGKDMAHLAERHPLLIFFDTYEEIDEGDHLLQICMGAAGERVGWIISGRDNLWAGATQRRRSLDAEYGYRDLVYPSRSIVINFSAEGVGDFTPGDINEYFKQICQKTNIPWIDEDSQKNVNRILEVTRGVPLAVRIAASLYLEQPDLTLITENIDHQREIVEQMVQRYLVHTRTNPVDRMSLYGLTLLRRVEDPSILAAALGITQEPELEAELSRLHRRYGFIFTKRGQPAIHQEVRYFLRLWLLQNRNKPVVMEVIQRLQHTLTEKFKAREKQYHYINLRARLEDKEWVQLYLDLTELEFWLDPTRGIKFLLSFMCAASIYRREANREARMQGQFFEEIMHETVRTHWKWADRCLVFPNNRNPLRDEFISLRDLVKLASEKAISFAPPLQDCHEELEAALWWRLAEAYSSKDAHNTIYWYEKARGRLRQEKELQKAYEDSIQGRDTLPTTPRSVNDYLQLGRESVLNNEPQHAIEHFNDALNLEETCIQAYIERGTAYLSLNEPWRAITDFDHALSLDPDNVVTLRKRGETYEVLKDLPRAIHDFKEALKLDPDNKMSREKLQALQKKLKERERDQKTSSLYSFPSAVRQRRRPRRRVLLTGIIIPALLIVGFVLYTHFTPITSPQSTSATPLLKLLYTYNGHHRVVEGVAWSPNGKYIASTGYDGEIHITNASNGQLLQNCLGNKGHVWRVIWSPDSKYVASGGDDGTVRIWNIQDDTQIFQDSQGQQVRGIAWSSDGSLASSNMGGMIKIWNVSNPYKITVSFQIKPNNNDILYGVAWSRTGKYLAVAHDNQTVDVWDLTGNGAPQKPLFTYKGHKTGIYFVAWSPDDKYIASASSDNTLQVWDAKTGANRFAPRTDFADSVFGVAWSPDGKYIASTSKDGSVHVYDAYDGHPVALYVGKHRDYMTGISWSPDSKRLVTGNFDYSVYVWQLP